MLRKCWNVLCSQDTPEEAAPLSCFEHKINTGIIVLFELSRNCLGNNLDQIPPQTNAPGKPIFWNSGCAQVSTAWWLRARLPGLKSWFCPSLVLCITSITSQSFIFLMWEVGVTSGSLWGLKMLICLKLWEVCPAPSLHSHRSSLLQVWLLATMSVRLFHYVLGANQGFSSEPQNAKSDFLNTSLHIVTFLLVMRTFKIYTLFFVFQSLEFPICSKLAEAKSW